MAEAPAAEHSLAKTALQQDRLDEIRSLGQIVRSLFATLFRITAVLCSAAILVASTSLLIEAVECVPSNCTAASYVSTSRNSVGTLTL